MPYINLLLIVYTFMAGLQFNPLKVDIVITMSCSCRSNIQAMFEACRIVSVSESTFYRYLNKLLYPVIWTYWLMDQARNIADIKVLFTEKILQNKYPFMFVE